MFFKKPKPAICVICGKPIGQMERRFVEKNRVTKTERHTHVGCRRPDREDDGVGRA